MKTKNSENEIREQVSQAYTKALKKAETGGGCCSSPGSNTAVQSSRYGADLEGIPADVVETSFGCGNPTAMAGIQEGEVVLDLGSGAGLDLLVVVQKVGPTGKAIGVDMTQAMIEAARANVAKAGVENAEVRQGTIEDLPVDDASVDWVISNCVINLSPEKEKVFAEIHRVLKPGGRFSISDMVVDSLPEHLKKKAAVHAACIGGAVSEREYKDGLASAGLTEIQIQERNGYHPTQVRSIIQTELDLDVPETDLEEIARTAKVESVRFTGKRPS